MKFFYSAGAMGYGDGYWWHRFFDFPKFPFVTKTLTIKPRKGNKWAILPVGKSVFNKVALDNIGFYNWYERYSSYEDATVSVAGDIYQIRWMADIVDHEINSYGSYFGHSNHVAVEINLSCPNVRFKTQKNMPAPFWFSNTDIYLKLNYKQDPYDYALDRVKGIRLNSIPLKFCGGSGKIAQKKNWKFIERYNKEGLNVAGCSFTSLDDIKRLEDMGCKEIGIGSIILTNPKLVEKLK